MRRKCSGACAALVLLAPLAAATATAKQAPHRVVGYAENAVVYPGGFRIKAKMDTGARTTSIHAPDYEVFKRNGKRWVRFALSFKGRTQKLELPVFRMSRIRRTNVGVVERPVVKLGICIAGYYKKAQVNLANRKRMIFPLLIGRRFMSTGRILIDSAKKYESKPTCPKAPKNN